MCGQAYDVTPAGLLHTMIGCRALSICPVAAEIGYQWVQSRVLDS